MNRLGKAAMWLVVLLLVARISLLAAEDSRFELAEHLSLVEILRHIRNQKELLDYSYGWSNRSILSQQPELRRSQLIGENHVLIERYFFLSNQGYKCYVNLNTKRCTVVCYGRNCERMIWKNIDRMLKDSKQWSCSAEPDRLVRLVLDFLLPRDQTVMTCLNDSLVPIQRNFAAAKRPAGEGVPSGSCDSSDVFYVFNPRLNILVEKPYFLQLTSQLSKSNRRLRFYRPGAKKPFFMLTMGEGDNYFGPKVNFDY